MEYNDSTNHQVSPNVGHRSNPSETDLTTPERELEKLLSQVKLYLGSDSVDSIKRAYEFAALKHQGQRRRSGEPYIVHPLQVTQILADYHLDRDSLIAAILHDVVEDTDATLEDLVKHFSADVAHLVDGMTKIGKMRFRSSQEKLAENFRKMVMAMAKDLRVILIKLADRLHNMRTLHFLKPEKSQRIAQETLDIYAPLANRLGIYGIKSELEDLCLRYINREVYSEIKGKISAKRAQRQAYINDVISILETELRKYDFQKIKVYGRPKHFYSIYKKMILRDLQFEDIHDLFAFRIIVDSVKDCYEALGIIHAMWKPMPGRFKDYIAMPKANLYQSLHTTVIRPRGEPAEIQIRTHEMQKICEHGVAAHWTYKEKSETMKPADLKKFSWLRQIMEWQSEIKDPDEFLEAVKVDLFEEEIFVFTPKGDVFELPAGATALDFAFAIHTDVGISTMGAKVNNRMVSIRKQLHSGDIVEILTSSNQRPNKDWLNFIKTSKARNRIRSYLRSEQREKSRTIGREILEQELSSKQLTLEKLQKTGEVETLRKAARESNLDDILINIGYGKIDAKELIAKAFPQELVKPSIVDAAREHTELKKPFPKSTRPSNGILVSGIEDVLVHFAKCCNALPGEPIVGYITRGRGVTVHCSTCPHALDLDPQRRIDVHWTESPGTKDTNSHIAYIAVITQDRNGVLAEITSAISFCNAGVRKASVQVDQNLLGCLDFELKICNLEQLRQVIKKIETIPSVVRVERRNSYGKD